MRPNCLSPQACQAKGPGHCRRCHGIALTQTAKHKATAAERMARLNAEPEAAQRSSEGCTTRYFAKLAVMGVLPTEEPRYREIRNKRFSAKEAAEIVIGSRR
jgi:hypothetical protein